MLTNSAPIVGCEQIRLGDGVSGDAVGIAEIKTITGKC